MVRRFIIFLLLALLITSCYHQELQYEFTTSTGGVINGSSNYYLANVRELSLPKGITKILVGGQPKITNQLIGLFSTDTISSSTFLVARIGEIKGWPTKYTTRIDSNDDFIVFGILNIARSDSLEGIYLYNLQKKALLKYSSAATLPAISKDNSMLAYCIDNRLVVEDYKSHVILMSYLLHSKPLFVTWHNEDRIKIFYNKPIRVDMLEIPTGRIIKTDLKFLPNYDQEVDTSKINRFLKLDKQKTKDLLISKKNNHPY